MVQLPPVLISLEPGLFLFLLLLFLNIHSFIHLVALGRCGTRDLHCHVPDL